MLHYVSVHFDNHFDAIASSHMFFFVEHPEKMLAEAYRVLKPDGRIVIVTMPPSKLARYLFFPYTNAMRCYDKNQMIELLARVGFNQVEVDEISLMQLAYAKKIIR